MRTDPSHGGSILGGGALGQGRLPANNPARAEEWVPAGAPVTGRHLYPKFTYK